MRVIDPMLNFYVRPFVSCYDVYTNLLSESSFSLASLRK
jgi:hypothetical protein